MTPLVLVVDAMKGTTPSVTWLGGWKPPVSPTPTPGTP